MASVAFNSVPQPAATTFAFSSVWFLFYGLRADSPVPLDAVGVNGQPLLVDGAVGREVVLQADIIHRGSSLIQIYGAFKARSESDFK